MALSRDPRFAVKVIETYYNGHRFRSRLEARWAVFMDSLNIGFRYEPDGYVVDGAPYLPDFYLPALECFVEIKPELPEPDAMRKCRALARATRRDSHLLFGQPWPGEYSAFSWLTFADGGVRAETSEWLNCELINVIRLGVRAPWCQCFDCVAAPGPVLREAFSLARSMRFEPRHDRA